MMKTDLSDVYRGYIACLNKQDWPKLEQFVHDDVLSWLLGISVRKESVTGDALRSCSLRSTHHVGGEKVSSMTVSSLV